VQDDDDNRRGLMPETSARSFERFTLFYDFVLQNYQLEKQIGHFHVWRKAR